MKSRIQKYRVKVTVSSEKAEELKQLLAEIEGLVIKAEVAGEQITEMVVLFKADTVEAVKSVFTKFPNVEVVDMSGKDDVKDVVLTDDDEQQRGTSKFPALVVGLIAGIAIALVVGLIGLAFALSANGKTNAMVTSTASIAKDVETMTKSLAGMPKKVQDLEERLGANGDVTRAITDVELLKQEFGKGDKAINVAKEANTAVAALTAEDGVVTQLASRVKALEDKKVASAKEVSDARAAAEWSVIKSENDAMLMKLAEVRRADPNSELAKLLDDDVKKAFTDAKKRAALKQQIEQAWLNRPAPAPQTITQEIVPDDGAIPKLRDELAAVKKIAEESHTAVEIIATSPKTGPFRHSLKESNKARARAALGIAPIEDAKPAKPPRPRPRIDREF